MLFLRFFSLEVFFAGFQMKKRFRSTYEFVEYVSRVRRNSVYSVVIPTISFGMIF